MAKKRKAPRSFEEPETRKSTKFDLEERFDDSEDEFYAAQDKILLDETPDSKRRRRIVDQEKNLQPSDEEVLPYKDYDDNSSDDDEDEALDDESIDLQSDQNQRRQNREQEDDEQSDEENWGTTRADYYGDDVIETEEQAREEELEAKRLHLKQLKNMTEADFGFDADQWAQEKKDSNQTRQITEKLPDAQIPNDATEEQKRHILVSRYPEFLPLAEDFIKLQTIKEELDRVADQESNDTNHATKLEGSLPVSIRRNALNTYLATISMYMAILSTTATSTTDPHKITALPPLDLHDHPIIHALARARRLWDQVEPLGHSQPVALPSYSQLFPEPVLPSEDADADIINTAMKEYKKQKRSVSTSKQTSKVKPISDSKPIPDQTRNHKSKKEHKRSNKDNKKLIDVNTLLEQTEIEPEDSDFGDEQPLTEEQYAEKARKRKSLRFYASQIASKANKRGHASRDAGGDDDLPYKERQKDKRDRLMREAETRGHQTMDAADDFGDDNDYEDMLTQHDTNDDYYNTLLNAKQKKKFDKQARAEAYTQAAKEGATVYEEETVGADGKRAITYAIAKNKGLTPKRSKDVRNPRVKKRKKYDEKLKKLGSVRQVYKGGEGRGGYGGELTGIKPNLVKSIKL